jgi:anti-sigma regulatory factor (Ser/Thr protein kinase)
MTDPSQIGEVRRAVAALTTRLGFDEERRGKAAIVVSEAATNLVKHAREGVVLLRPLESDNGPGIELLALDRGPGMTDLEQCLSDAFSTAGTSGNGLGAIARMSDFADFYSRPPGGTAILARLWLRPTPSFNRPCRFEEGVVSVPLFGEEVCGDSWATTWEQGRCLVLVADGLGHGPFAAEASLAAVRIFLASARLGPGEALQAAHLALRGTRGAAVAIAELDFDAGVVRFAGVGNIAGVVVDGASSRSLVSHNGTVGHNAHKFQEFNYPFPKGALLVMHSDGLASRWGLGPYPRLAAHDPGLVAAVLYRDFQRSRDDVTVLVAREHQEGSG